MLHSTEVRSRRKYFSRTVLSTDSHSRDCLCRGGWSLRGSDAAVALGASCCRRPSCRGVSTDSAETYTDLLDSLMDSPGSWKDLGGSSTDSSDSTSRTVRLGSTKTGLGSLCRRLEGCGRRPRFHNFLSCHPIGYHRCCLQIPCTVYISFCAWKRKHHVYQKLHPNSLSVTEI